MAPSEHRGRVAEFAHRLPVRLAELVRVRDQLTGLLEVLEPDPSVERQVELVAIEHVQEHDLVVAVAQAPERVLELGLVREEVRRDDDHGALRRLVRDLGQQAADARLAGGRGLLEHLRERREMALRRGVRQEDAAFLVDDDERRRVALLAEERREPGDRGRGVVVLRARARAVSHRRARVDDERRAQVVLGLAEADDVVARAPVDAPVEPPQVVARHVGPVIDELGALPEPGLRFRPARSP